MKPDEWLDVIFDKACKAPSKSRIHNDAIRERIEFVRRCMSNRAGVRLLMSCLLGKLDKPSVDPRKPYTEINGKDCFSGRAYDEQYITAFINRHHLPANQTTAFLTPTLRNIAHPLTTGIELVGRPRELYQKTLQLLEDVAENRITAKEVFVDIVRNLINIRDEQQARINSLLESLKRSNGVLEPSSEDIVTLIRQHLACKNSSRLPVLVIAAAYQAVGTHFSETILPLKSHNAADLQTGALGDVEVCLKNDNEIATVYEMKMKRVTREDIDAAILKIARSAPRIQNYIFITTDVIEPSISKYAADCYERTDGVEIAILDCIGFLRHFLHFFHRYRSLYLDSYQKLLLSEADSAVSQALKEAFLALRHSAESD
ncbi:MAG: restriction endonuclease, SacI family [Puniceicoccales bacterium]|jgi:hypothetical protein|nr:restriction endonuclease, SacI family [Puniceicoccales bacterium]